MRLLCRDDKGLVIDLDRVSGWRIEPGKCWKIEALIDGHWVTVDEVYDGLDVAVDAIGAFVRHWYHANLSTYEPKL